MYDSTCYGRYHHRSSVVWHGPVNGGTHSTVPQSQEGPKPHHRAHGAGLLSFQLPTQAQNVELSADTERHASRPHSTFHTAWVPLPGS